MISKLNLRVKITIYFTLIPLFLFGIFAIYSIRRQKRYVNRQAEITIIEREVSIKKSIQDYLTNFEELSKRIGYNVQLVVPLFYKVQFQAHDFLKQVCFEEHIESAFIVDPTKKVYVSNHLQNTNKLEDVILSIPDLLLRNSFFYRFNNSILAVSVTPINYKANHLGHLIITKKFDLKQNINPAVLLDSNTVFSISENGQKILHFANLSLDKTSNKTKKFDTFFLRNFPFYDYNNKIIAHVVFGIDQAKALQYNKWYIFTLIVTFIIILISVIIGGFLLGHSIADPIVELAKITQKIIHENENFVPVYEKSDDEIKTLYENTSQMVHHLIDVQQELRVAIINAQESTRIKSQFLANMSHEIRTPLNGIIGISAILMEQDLPDESAEYVSIVYNSGTKLLHLINDILDISKIEEGKLIIEEKTFNLYESIVSLLDVHKVQASNKDVTLWTLISPDIPEQIISDETRLAQILNNIVGNAVKFTSKGEIKVDIHIVKENEDKKIRFQVSDTGVGIPQDKIETIFDAFTQADGSTTRKFGGTGLGTTIAKQIVEKMNGSIWAESPNPYKEVMIGGPGSVFTFEIPLNIATETQTQQADKHDITFDNASILVAEDNAANQLVISKFFDSLHIHYTLVDNGKSAIDKLLEANFDLILMDIQMPIMNGLDATKEIRSLGFQIPIIALTANAMKNDMTMALKQGMNAYLTKPIHKKDLIFILERWLKVSAKQHRFVTTKKNNDDHEKIFDIDKAYEILEDREIIQDVMMLFLSDISSLQERMKIALESKDYDTVKSVSHSIKGASANLALPAVFKASKNIESALQKNEIKNVSKMITILNNRIDEVRLYLKKNPI